MITAPPLTTKASRKISELRQPHVTTNVRKQSQSRNDLNQRTHPHTLNSPSQRDIELNFWRDNPMFEMRPLIGKEQLRQSKLVTQGTGAMDRDSVNNDINSGNEYDFRSSTKQVKSIGR